MFTEAEMERDRSEARRKWQLDYNTGLKVARLEGEKIGIIHFCEQVLHRPETPTEQLAGLSLEELTRIAGELQEQVLQQR